MSGIFPEGEREINKIPPPPPPLGGGARPMPTILKRSTSSIARDAVLDYPQSGERTCGRRNIQDQRNSQPSKKRFTFVRRIVGWRRSLGHRIYPDI